MSETLQIAAVCAAGYVLGAIPFGVLIARAKGVDIMAVGSGNIGATNVSRVLGRTAGVTVFLLDCLKGLLPAIVARWVTGEAHWWFVAGFFAVLGHTASPFLKFKGGKGVATALGMALGAAPIPALIGFGLFFVVLFATKYMSLASIVGVCTAVVVEAFMPTRTPWTLAILAILASMIVYRHHANIVRLRKGEEPKFTFKKSADIAPSKPASNEAAEQTTP